ncbi:hypothetical protein GWI34_06375 [Actinomadura sp. DSM 109109]|nr:hypothetical protein [Actinomadura lepetitiana]
MAAFQSLCRRVCALLHIGRRQLATPAELAPVLDAYRAVRSAGRFEGLPRNPDRARAEHS